MTGDPRCCLCAARMWAPTARRLRFPSGLDRAYAYACGSCGLLCDDPSDGAAGWRDLETRLGMADFFLPDDAPVGLDLFTLRIAATRLARGIRPSGRAEDQALARPHGRTAPEARLFDLAAGETRAVSLGLLCRPDDLAALVGRASPHRAWAREIVVLVDAPAVPEAPPLPGMRVAARVLDRDFAAQRNALQDLSRTDWMIQLDADETIGEDTGRLLPALAALADHGGVRSIGLPRRNHVDGVLSDIFPDTQYRLNRRSVRYRGAVHERPDRDWRESLIALHGAIDHHLAGIHVARRSRVYEGIAPGGGRLEEAEALLRPYRD